MLEMEDFSMEGSRAGVGWIGGRDILIFYGFG